MEPRLFTFSEGSSNKWWQIEVVGHNILTNYGRMGNEGQESIKEYATDEDAVIAAVKLVKSKIKKGYVEAVDDGI